MADVFVAERAGKSGFTKKVVLKCLRPDRENVPEYRAMLEDEARIAAHLNHPHIVETIDVGMADGRFFITLEYVDGWDLAQIQAAGRNIDGWIPWRVATHIVSKVCNGLDYAHRRRGPDGRPLGIIHRDISPDNVLVSQDGHVKLIDFGIARAEPRTTRTEAGIVKGKCEYMSPEQVLSLPLDHRSDLFSVGVVLYELLSGLRPFNGRTTAEVAHAVVHEPAVDIRDVVRNVPNGLAHIVHRALEKDRNRRWPDARSLQEAIDGFALRQGWAPGRRTLLKHLRHVSAEKTMPSEAV